MFIDENVLKAKAVTFVRFWKNQPGDEKAEGQTFLTRFLDVLGIERILYAYFEHRVPMTDGRKGFIDMLWKGQILIEMKSAGKDMEEAYIQAKNYAWSLPAHDKPKVILICDFRRFDYYDMLATDETGQPKKVSFTLDELPDYLDLFYYLIDEGRVRAHLEQERVNIQAAELMGNLHDYLYELGYSREYLEKFLVRLLFCLFAEDTGIFEKKLFEDVVRDHKSQPQYLGTMIGSIFKILNTPPEKRVKSNLLNRFAYVNGRLFEYEIDEAAFDAKALELLLKCCEFDWKFISPAIFGAMFQSIMNKDHRRELGAHYTSEENILKVLRPLFLDDLRAEFSVLRAKFAEKERRENTLSRKVIKGSEAPLKAFHARLSRLKFLDPACGCGNFLVIAYRELRRLELDILSVLYRHGQQGMNVADMSQIDVSQFYGIEIEDFPAEIAQVAMWLMDHLMCLELRDADLGYAPRIPLTKSATIIHGNALAPENDWEKICPKAELSYIIGNPPFSGFTFQTERQKKEMQSLFPGIKNLDYVACWFRKAAEFMVGTEIKTAFVSTNSISQGEAVTRLWEILLSRYHVEIIFAHQTFKWSNEGRGMAAVHCVIIGFSCAASDTPKALYTYETITSQPQKMPVSRINPYLVDGPDILVKSRNKPLCEVPPMVYGNKPADGGNLIIEACDYEDFLAKEPAAKPYIRPMLGSVEFINNMQRYCLWLVNTSPQEIKKMPMVVKRIAACRKMRESSIAEGIRKFAVTPAIFAQVTQPEGCDYILIPRVSSERRKYIPMGFVSADVIVNDRVLIIPHSDLYHFGILTSTMHMAWTRCICMRLKSDYSYSKDIVYNNFPWPEDVSETKREKVMELAQAVLDARAKYPDSSLADLYDPNTMPPALARAHEKLDKYIDRLYRKTGFPDDSARVAHLFAMYQQLTSVGELPLAEPKTPKNGKRGGK